MKYITQSGKIYDQKRGEITLDDIDHKEIYLDIAAKLYSIRGMLKFFTAITTIGIIMAVISLLSSLAGHR